MLKINLSTTVCLSLVLATASWPVQAQRVGPRGTQVEGSGMVVPKPGGGYAGGAEGSVTGANGGSVEGRIQVRTDGEGTSEYSGEAAGTGPQGNSAEVTTSGTASYNEEEGTYHGENTTTVNGQTYTSTTEDGSTTITNSTGETTTLTRPGAR